MSRPTEFDQLNVPPSTRWRATQEITVQARQEQAARKRHAKAPPQAVPYEECLRRLLNRSRTVTA